MAKIRIAAAGPDTTYGFSAYAQNTTGQWETVEVWAQDYTGRPTVKTAIFDTKAKAVLAAKRFLGQNIERFQ